MTIEPTSMLREANRHAPVLFLMFLTCIATSCGPSADELVTGEVFIKTKGGDAVTLSLVEVGFVDSDKAKEAIVDRRTAQPPPKNYRDLMTALPRPIVTTKTDSRGQFQARIPKNRRYVVTAIASRLLHGETEEYYWAVFYPNKSSKATGKIILANDNLPDTFPFGDSLLPPPVAFTP
jgi:hypothetical protein